ncbi:RNB domain-containing ribonuclease, partial [archaeon]
VRTGRLAELLDMRLLVAIDAWPSSSEMPGGHFVRIFGKQGDRSVENEVLLFELGVANTAFSNAVMACLPPPDWHITEEMIASRVDLRHLPITSVDPPGCKDIDDALHCIRLPNGHYQAGVHIAGKWAIFISVLASC